MINEIERDSYSNGKRRVHCNILVTTIPYSGVRIYSGTYLRW
jgi:hypothetical protein